MKYLNRLMTGLATVAALTFTACGDDPVEPEAHYETIEISVNPDKAESTTTTVKFKAKAWTLTSDQIWCQLRQGDKTAMSLTGDEMAQEVEIVVDPTAATDEEQHATLTLNTKGKDYILARVTLGKITYRGTITHNGHAMHSDTSKGIYVFDMDGELSLSANFDFHLEMPDWCLVNGSNSFQGKSGEEYLVEFTFNEGSNVDKRYKQEGELVFASNTVRDVFTIVYAGMDKYKAEVEIGRGPSGELLAPWGWTIDPKAQTYSRIDGQNNTVVLDGGIPFSVMCRNDAVQFVAVTTEGGKYNFDAEPDYVNIAGEAGQYTFSLKDVEDMPGAGELLAFSVAAWDTIKADPAKCLMVMNDDGEAEWRYEVNNNLVVKWQLHKESANPFEMLVNARTWATYYEPEETHEYDNQFGCNGAWAISADLTSTNILIQPKEEFGYETAWFGQGNIYAGFAPNKMVNTIDELEAMGFEPMNDQLHDKPALFLNLTEDYHAAAAAGPMFIAFRKDNNTLLLVIKPE